MITDLMTRVDIPWPEADLESVRLCPYCGSQERSLVYKDVQDWTFYCANGKWNYWECSNCQSLYLNPRPTQSTIGTAYAKYHTHTSTKASSVLSVIKDRVKNEWWSYKLCADIEPRLHLPRFLQGSLSLVEKRVGVPFGWMMLVKLRKGRFMDVGCGSGQAVDVAQQLGWDAMGIENDPIAVSVARDAGLNIIEATYEQLMRYPQQFDCIMCSHVLEHVHDPRDLLTKIKLAIKPGGVLLLSLPNSLSAVRRHFGVNWRGLEAPRHISIPSEPQLIKMLAEFGFSVRSLADNVTETAAGSYRIQRRGSEINSKDVAFANQLDLQPLATPFGNDLIKLVCESGGMVMTY